MSNERVTSQVLNALGGGLLGALLWVLSLHLGRVAVETSIGPATVSGALCGLLVRALVRKHTPGSGTGAHGRNR